MGVCFSVPPTFFCVQTSTASTTIPVNPAFITCCPYRIVHTASFFFCFSLPALYRKKKSGDLTLWGKGRNILGQLPSEEAACAAVSSSSRNGSQKDILQFVSSLMKLVRKNHWYIVMPGQLSDGKPKTNLSLVLITQHRVIGLKCYGYGGSLTNNGKAADLDTEAG